MLDEKTRVEVESIGMGSVGYQPSHNPLIHRRWDKPGIKKKIPFEEIQEVMSETGGYNLFTHHLLIRDVEVREALDLPVDKELNYGEKDLEKMLNGNPAKLREQLETMPEEIKQRTARKAAEMNIDSVPKIKIIKDITGIDVYKLIEANEEKNKQPQK